MPVREEFIRNIHVGAVAGLGTAIELESSVSSRIISILVSDAGEHTADWSPLIKLIVYDAVVAIVEGPIGRQR